MSPTVYRPGRGIVVWRGMIVVALLAVALLTVAVVALFNTNHDSIEKGKEAIAASRELSCRIGGFLVGVPVVKQPGTKESDFQKQVGKAREFLTSLKRLDCNGLGHVTTAKIEAQQKALHAIQQQGGGGSSGSAPGSLPGGGTTPAPSSPPPPNPPPTTTTPPPGGGGGGPPLRRVCHTILMRTICDLVPAVFFGL